MLLMLTPIWRLLSPTARLICSICICITFTALWIFVGNTSSVYNEFKSTNDVAKQKKRLPEVYLPLQPGSELYGVREVTRKKAFSKGTRTISSYFTMPYLESSVSEYYHKQLPQDGWAITSDSRNNEGTTIEVKKGELTGSVHVLHLESGSELELSVTSEDATVQ
jgi:hypothetical protein